VRSSRFDEGKEGAAAGVLLLVKPSAISPSSPSSSKLADFLNSQSLEVLLIIISKF